MPACTPPRPSCPIPSGRVSCRWERKRPLPAETKWSKQYGSQATQTKEYIGLITNYYSKLGVAEIRMDSHDLKLGEQIMIIGPTTGVYEDTLSEIRVDLGSVEQTVKGEYCSIPVKSLVRRGDKVYKVVSTM